jgi:hypothetical protein
MKKLIPILLLLAVTNAFAHAGHVHTYMGTVTMLHSDTQFMLKTSGGKDVTIDTTPKTSWLDAKGQAAKKSELKVGSRVVVKMNTDGRTATTVTMASPPTKK